jgi:hypothetical protein
LFDLLSKAPTFQAAWLVRKELQQRAERALFILCVKATRSSWDFNGLEVDKSLVRKLTAKVNLPGQVLIISPHESFAALARKVMAKPGLELRLPDKPVA